MRGEVDVWPAGSGVELQNNIFLRNVGMDEEVEYEDVSCGRRRQALLWLLKKGRSSGLFSASSPMGGH